jgi:hypothetical protein
VVSINGFETDDTNKVPEEEGSVKVLAPCVIVAPAPNCKSELIVFTPLIVCVEVVSINGFETDDTNKVPEEEGSVKVLAPCVIVAPAPNCKSELIVFTPLIVCVEVVSTNAPLAGFIVKVPEEEGSVKVFPD